ncbi:ATP synthase subunit I [Paenibacillus gansuensis]|uniref:ATP synthase subunit I n=1 Tax=Paenibacillus gansuensis TaxID=306542 RepID=A0ABW5PJ94_9BACL
MDELSARLKTVYRAALFFLSLCLLVWALYPPLRGMAAGLLIGTAASLVNMYYLSMKVRQAAEIAESGQKRRFNLGFLTRAAVGVLAVMLALRLGSDVELFGVILGLLFWQLAVLLAGLFHSFKR